MKIDLNIPRGQKQQAFLDYLNAAFREKLKNYTGSAGFNTEGQFESSISGQFPLNQSSVLINWTVVKDSKGELLYISAEPDVSKVEAGWEIKAHEFINSVLISAFSEKQKQFFRRSFYYYAGPMLDGEYWLPGYRLAPAFPSDTNPSQINAERVISIDQNINAIDEMQAFAVAEESSRRHAARLSLLLDTALYTPEPVQRWIIPSFEGQPIIESFRYTMGFTHPSLNLESMPKKGEQCRLGEYKSKLAAKYRVAGELLSLPREARKILRNVDKSSPAITNAFDCGSRLYQVATVCGRMFPSVGLAYRVAAVEAVSKADHTCNSFSDFMRKYVKSETEIDFILDYLYRVARSSHFHAGEFPSGEFERHKYFNALMDSDEIKRDSINRICYSLIREAIVNWIYALIPDDDNLEIVETDT